jgi:hypothetical protein
MPAGPSRVGNIELHLGHRPTMTVPRASAHSAVTRLPRRPNPDGARRPAGTLTPTTGGDAGVCANEHPAGRASGKPLRVQALGGALGDLAAAGDPDRDPGGIDLLVQRRDLLRKLIDPHVVVVPHVRRSAHDRDPIASRLTRHREARRGPARRRRTQAGCGSGRPRGPAGAAARHLIMLAAEDG